MTTTPAPTDLDLDALKTLERAATAAPWRVADSLPSPSVRTERGTEIVYNPWGSKNDLRFIAAARNALPALLDELAERRQHEARIWRRIQAWNDDPTTRLEAFAITWERVEAAQGERDAARAELDGRVAWLYRNSTRMTQMCYDAMSAAKYDFTQYTAQMNQPVDRDELLAYLREEIALAEREIALIEANPATTAEPADEPKADPYPLVPQDFRDAVAKTAAERWPDKYGTALPDAEPAAS